MSLKFRSIPTKTLSQNLSSSGTTLYLNNTLDWDDAQLSSSDFGTQAFVVLRNASNTQIEIIEIDPATVTSANAITILKRGVGYDGGQTANTETKYNWSAFDTYVELGADSPQIFQYVVDLVNAAVVTGAANATSALQGLVELATQAEYDAGTATGGTGAPLVATPAVARGKKYIDYAADSVGTDAYAITVAPAIGAYAAGQEFTFKAGTANTGACTLNVSGLGAKAIKKNVSEDLATSDILADQIVKVVYDGTNMQFVNNLPSPSPVVRVYTANAFVGSKTTQFDITQPVGNTFRYTWDTTGTDPSFSLANYPIGTVVDIQAQNFSAGNKGLFVTTGAGANYIEVTNASGVVESDKTIGTGYINKGAVWTKPSGLKYVKIQAVGAGAGTWSTDSPTSGNQNGTGGAGAGGYAEKIVAATSLSATENYVVGVPGQGGVDASNGVTGTTGARTLFGSIITALGGAPSDTFFLIAFAPRPETFKVQGIGGVGGTASGGDINIMGGDGTETFSGSTSSADSEDTAGVGGISFFGGSGNTSSTGAYGSGGHGVHAFSGQHQDGNNGQPGVIILTEYYS